MIRPGPSSKAAVPDGSTPPPLDDDRSVWTLRFRDPQLEARFVQENHERNLPWIAGSLAFGLLMMAGFYFIDRRLLPAELMPQLLSIRFLHMVPLGFVAIAVLLTVRQAALAVPLISILFVIFGAGWTRLLLAGDTQVAMYASAAMSQTVLFAYVCLCLPFRWSAGVVLAMVATMYVALAALGITQTVGLHVVATLGAIVLIGTLGAYRYEWSVRDRFVSDLRYRAEYDLRLASERERSDWLGTIAGFVRHELKNAIAGVGSSLQLAWRGSDERNREIIERADRSLRFMRHVLQQVGDATNLESALKRQDMEGLSLSELVAGRLDDYREQFSKTNFAESIQPGLRVTGNADSLVQMLDKLVNNAIEHAAAGSTVRVALAEHEDRLQLEVANRGDPLPDGAERLFQPFVSTKAGNRDGNLGLGLYVAKVIAMHHGGSISAEPLHDPPGARLIVRLPRAPLGSCDAV